MMGLEYASGAGDIDYILDVTKAICSNGLFGYSLFLAVWKSVFAI